MAVNRLVAVSNPARGAKQNQGLRAKLGGAHKSKKSTLAAYLAAIAKTGLRQAVETKNS